MNQIAIKIALGAVATLYLAPIAFSQSLPIEKICLPGAENRATDQERFTKELLKDHPIQITPDLLNNMVGDGDMRAVLASAISIGEVKCLSDKNCGAAQNIINRTEGYVADKDGRSPFSAQELVPEDPDDERRVGLDFYAKSSPYKLTCKPGSVLRAAEIIQIANDNKSANEKKKEPCGSDARLCVGLDRLIIAKTTDDLRKSDKKDRAAFELGFTLDRANPIEVENEDGTKTEFKNEDVTFEGVFALNDIFNSAARKDTLVELEGEASDGTKKYRTQRSLTPLVSPFVALKYDQNISPSDEIDDLTIGVTSNWRLPFGNQGSFIDGIQPGITVGYITDIEERESAQWVLETKFPLPFERIDFLKPLTGALNYNSPPQDGFQLLPYWSLSGVLDYGDIVDAGDKTELETIEEYQRFGYDIRADWFLLRGNASLPQTSLRLDYSSREDFSGEPSDARMFKGTLAFKPDAASDFSFKLVYEEGEVLTSLKDVEQWKLVIGYKQ